jgi:hypothetical protein
MPLKLHVGLSKKIGLPDYGSLGASCHVELELDQSLLFTDLDSFQDKVRQAFIACNQAVKDELRRQQPDGQSLATGKERTGAPPCAGNGRGHLSDSGARKPRDRTRPATASQVRAIDAIALRQDLDLAQILWDDFGCSRADELTITEASRLIDALKAPAKGNGKGHANGHAPGESA